MAKGSCITTYFVICAREGGKEGEGQRLRSVMVARANGTRKAGGGCRGGANRIAGLTTWCLCLCMRSSSLSSSSPLWTMTLILCANWRATMTTRCGEGQTEAPERMGGRASPLALERGEGETGWEGPALPASLPAGAVRSGPEWDLERAGAGSVGRAPPSLLSSPVSLALTYVRVLNRFVLVELLLYVVLQRPYCGQLVQLVHLHQRGQVPADRPVETLARAHGGP